MAEKRRLNLSFSLASLQQREAWHILRAIPAGQRTDAVCRMVCKAQEQDVLLSAIRRLIRDELRDIQMKTEPESHGGDVAERVLAPLAALPEGHDMLSSDILIPLPGWAVSGPD